VVFVENYPQSKIVAPLILNIINPPSQITQ
jgi:hypothetical protein